MIRNSLFFVKNTASLLFRQDLVAGLLRYYILKKDYFVVNSLLKVETL